MTSMLLFYTDVVPISEWTALSTKKKNDNVIAGNKENLTIVSNNVSKKNKNKKDKATFTSKNKTKEMKKEEKKK
jgi:hypothetical protein